MGKEAAAIIFLFLSFYSMEILVAVAATSPLNSSTDEHILLAIKSHIITSDPNNILASNWLVGTDFCAWIGITCCQKHLRVTKLILFNRGLQGTIPKEIGNLSFLTNLNLAQNNLSGSIPSSLGDLRALIELDLSSNRLSGEIPLFLGQLSNLDYLGLSFSSFDSTMFEDHFAKLSKLTFLRLSSLKFKVKFDWVPPFQLRRLVLNSCDIGGQFPQWVQMQKGLEYLEMKNCSISDTLSNSLNNFGNLTYLHLSNNQIQGPIPNNISQTLPFLNYLYLHQNNINGSLPDSLCEMKYLLLMDFSKNHLSGYIPECLGNLEYLMYKIPRRGCRNMSMSTPKKYQDL